MRLKWIDNLKLIAATGVFVCHYTEAFAMQNAGNYLLPQWLITGYRYPLSMLINGEFWVCVFCVLSGYLLAGKQIDSVHIWFKTCINRYFRFLIPFTFANLLVWIIQNTFGFYSKMCGNLIQNTWLMNQYVTKYTLIEVMQNSIILGSDLNSCFWIIRHMFVASCFIYLTNYICYKYQIYVIKYIFLLAFLLFPPTYFIGCVYLGSILPKVSVEQKEKIQNKKIFLFILSILMMSGTQNFISDCIGVSILKINQYWELFYAAIIIVCIYSSNYLSDIFGKLKWNKFAKQSLTIYLLHWPVICSFSAWCFITFIDNQRSYIVLYLLIFLVTLIVLEIVVYVYSYLIDKMSNRILEKIVL